METNALTTLSVPTGYRSLSRGDEVDVCHDAGLTLALAFATDPAMQHAMPATGTRSRVLPLLYEKLTRIAALIGGAEVLRGGGAALWLESTMEAPFLLSIRLGFLRVLLRMGPVALLRLMRHEDFCAKRAKKVGPRRYGYLWVLGVHPHLQRKGLGRLLIELTLVRLRERGHTVCLLKTEREDNAQYYQNLGFSCVETVVVPSSGIRYWLLQKTLDEQGPSLPA